ncbi:MAG: MFS transporter [Pseudomonadota bacterium]|nr:MFS transporter [Pseudomonadota bacterium]
MNLRRDRFATSLLFFANGFGFGGWSATIAPMQRALALSNGELGLLLLMLALGAVSFMPIAGALGPRLGGTGTVSIRAGLAFCVCFALAALAPGAGALALAGLALGASNGLMDVTMNAHAADVERAWAKPIMSSFHAAFSVGGLVGASFGAALLAAGGGWRTVLLGLGLFAAAMIAGAAAGLSPGERPKTTQSPFGWPPRALVGLAGVALLCFIIEGAMIDWDGVYLVSLGVAPAVAPLGYAAFAATMILGRLFGDVTIARIGRLPAVFGGAALAAAGLALASLWPALIPAALGFALVGAGLSNVVPALFSESAAHASSPARGIAAVATAGYSGLLAGPPLVGAIASVADLRIAFAALAAMSLLAAALAARAR